MKDPVNFVYAIGSVVGPHPFPKMMRDVQRGRQGAGHAGPCRHADAGQQGSDSPLFLPEQTILVNLSGRGDKDADFVANYLSL